MEYNIKRFSEKQNSEKKKKSKKNSIAKATATGATLGGALALSTPSVLDDLVTPEMSSKAIEKYNKVASSHNDTVNRAMAVHREVQRRGQAGHPQYQALLKNVINPELERRKELTDKALGKIEKIGKAQTRKGALKAVGIATGIGAGIGLAAGLAQKKSKK